MTIREITVLSHFVLVFFVIAAFTGLIASFCITIILGICLRVYRQEPLSQEVASRLLGSVRGEGTNEEHKRVGRIILHRGGVVERPENTLEAIREANKHNVCGVEVDLEFTKDKVGILLHDDTVDRTTDGCGKICSMKLDEVQNLDAAAKHPCREKVGAVKIPTIEECMKECLDRGLVLFIDCKSQPKETANLMIKLFQKYPELYKKAVVCSFYPQVIYAVRKADPMILTGLTHRHKVLTTTGDALGTPRNKEMWKRLVAPVLDVLLEWSHSAWLWYICGNSFFLINKDSLSSNVYQFWKKLGIEVLPWTVNSPTEKDYFLHHLGCPIITDGMNTS